MNGEIVGAPIEILLVEDSPGDVRLMVEALKEGNFWFTIAKLPVEHN